MSGYPVIDTPKQMVELPDWSVVVSAVHDLPEVGRVCIAVQKVDGGWYGVGMGDVPSDPYSLRNFFPAVLVFQMDKGLPDD